MKNNDVWHEGYNKGYIEGYIDGISAFKDMENYPIKLVMNAEDAKEYKISEDISKGFEKFTEIMYKQGEEKRNEDSN